MSSNENPQASDEALCYNRNQITITACFKERLNGSQLVIHKVAMSTELQFA